MRLLRWLFRLLFGSRRSQDPPSDPLDTVAIPFNKVGDCLTWGDATAGGILIAGAPRSGKTACSGAAIRWALLTGMVEGRLAGGLVLTVKPGEADMWLREARLAGREADVVRITLPPTDAVSLNSYHSFDPWMYESRRPGRGAGNVSNIVGLLSSLAAVGTPHAMGGGDASSQFFQKSSEMLARAAVHVLTAAGEAVSLQNIQHIILTLPHQELPDSSEELTPAAQRWFAASYTGRCITKAAERAENGELTAVQVASVTQAIEYLGKAWPRLAPETSTSISATFASKAAELLEHPFSAFLCSGRCTFLPEQAYLESKIFILDMPVTQYGMAGRLAQIAVLETFYQVINRRDVKAHPGIVFAYMDESQWFITKASLSAAQIARENRLCLCFITQSVTNLAVEFGEQQVGAKTKAFLGCLGVKIFHQNGETETNQYAADLYGKRYVEAEVYGPGGPSMHQEERWRVPPPAFSSLPIPSSRNPVSVAVVYRGGQTWNAPDEYGEATPRLVVHFPLLAALSRKEGI